MYRLDWIEQLKLRTATRPGGRQIAGVSPVVWKLGFTSLLTDISAEMVNSALPVFVVLYLHQSPLQYGAIDGLYNGFAVALLSLAGGLFADRMRRQKEVAAAGYGLSAICKLLLLAVGGAWGWLAAITALDRTGKGLRTAPRDALISMNAPREQLASAFAVHRALDAGGSLLGPIIAFALLARLPGQFGVLWMTSFVFAVLGLAVLWLFVQNPPLAPSRLSLPVSLRSTLALLAQPRFRTIAGCGFLLSLATVSDGFLYLLMQRNSGVPDGYFPLFYVVTACAYMLFSIPVGRAADALGRKPVLLSGYSLLLGIYGLVWFLPAGNFVPRLLCLLLLGLYYAATEGVLTAMASALIPEPLRTSGLALLATGIGVAKLLASVLFGWAWQAYEPRTALTIFGFLLAAALVVSSAWLNRNPDVDAVV